MNLGKMFIIPSTRPRKALSEVTTAEPCFIIQEKMDGSTTIKYHVNLIDLLDKVFLNDIQDFLSIEQDRFIDMFYKKAGKVTDKLNSNDENPYESMDTIMRQLDIFLGGYIGEDNGKYTR
jgi:hypothetical protein